MTITLELPDDLASHADPARDALIEFAIECYRKEVLSLRKAAAMLDMYFGDFAGLLKARGVMEGAYDEVKLQTDIESLDRLRTTRSKSVMKKQSSSDDKAA